MINITDTDTRTDAVLTVHRLCGRQEGGMVCGDLLSHFDLRNLQGTSNWEMKMFSRCSLVFLKNISVR